MLRSRAGHMALVLAGLWATWTVRAAEPEPSLLARVGEYVEAYFGRAQSLLTDETVVIQPLNRDLSSDGFPRRLQYETRVEWNPDADTPATVVRTLLRINGRAPRERDEPRCTDPQTVSPEPLAALLPRNQGLHRFTALGEGAVAGRRAAQFEFVRHERQTPTTRWKDDCVEFDAPGRARVWVDRQTGEVLRFDEHMLGIIDIPVPRDQQGMSGQRYLTIERVDTTIRYADVAFADPPERLLLPTSVETLVVARTPGTRRVIQSFTNYRRFVTDSRVLP